MVKTGVKVMSFLPGSGYGDAAALYMKGLHDLGVPVSGSPLAARARTWPGYGIAPIEGDDLTPWIDESPDAAAIRWLFHRPIVSDVLLVHLPCEWWGKCLEENPGRRPVVYTTWETDRLPAGWADMLNRFDLVLVPCRFNQRLFVENGVRVPVEIVPHGARPAAPVPGGVFGDVAADDFVFYTIGEWRTRKAIYEALRAYLDAFSADDKVAFIIKTGALDHEAHMAFHRGLVDNPPRAYLHTWWTVTRILSEYRRPAKVHLIARTTPRTVIDQLHTRGDCFVSLTHGEGWGLGAFDAALFDRPSIMTGWSGHLDYLGADNPLLVAYTLETAAERAPDGRVIKEAPEQRWATADRAHASRLMRWAFEHPDEIRELGTAMGERIRREFDATRVCRRLAGLLGFELLVNSSAL